MAQPKPKTITRYIPAGMNIAPQNKDILFEQDYSSSSKKKNKKKKKSTETNLETFIMDDDFLEYTSQRQQHSISPNDSQLNSGVSEEFSAPSLNKQPSQVVNDTAQNKCTPPKTICRNKSIVLDVDLQGNQNSVFVVGLKNNKIPSVPVKPEEVDTKQPDVSFETAQVVSKPVGITFKDKVLQTINRNLQQNKSSNEKSYPNHEINYNNSKNGDSPTKVENNCVASHKTNELSKNITQNKEHPNKFIKQLTQQNGMVEKEGWYEDNIMFGDGNSEPIARKGVPLLRNSDLTNSTEMIREISKNIIIHGMIIPKPVHSLEEAFFTETVSEALQARSCTSPTELQSFMWPAIQRGFNVFMVAPSQSGKKFAYLPALITFAVGLSNNYKGLKKYKGPLIVIICTDNDKCKEIRNLIDNLVQNSLEMVGTASDISSLETCDILVVTPSDLDKLLKSGKITLKRLCHIVLDQANVFLKSDARFMSEFLRMVNEMQKNRPHNKNIQVIVSSEKWTADIGVIMRKLYLPPVLCFADFLEAALYSNIDFKKKKLNSAAHKKFLLEDILKQKYSMHRSIVFCNENEIPEMREYLEIKGIECISISNDLIEDEIFENEDMWCSLKIGRFKVLLCTDKLFQKTGHIVNANWLIHYSLPSDWKTFQYRFRSLVENIKYPLTTDNSDTYEENCSYTFTVGDSKQASTSIFNDFFNGLITAKISFLKL